VSGVVNNVKNKVTSGVNTVKNKVARAVTPVKNKVSGVVNNVKNKVTSGVNTVKNKVARAVTPVKNKVSAVVNNVKNKVTSGVNTVKNKVARAVTPVKNKVSGVVNNVKNKVTSGVNTVKNKVARAVTPVKNKVSGVVNNVKNKVSSGVNTVKNKVARVVTPVKNKVSGVVNNVKNKVTSGVNTVKNQVAGVVNNVKNKVSRGVNTVKNKVAGVVNTVKNKVSSGVNTVKNKVTGVVNSATNKVTSGVNTVKNTVKQTGNQLKNTAGNLSQKGKNALSSLTKLTGNWGTDAGQQALEYWAATAVEGENQGGLGGLAKQAAGNTFGSLAALWTRENAATTAVTLGTAGLGAAANAGKLGSLGTGAIAQLGKVATALAPVGKGLMLGGAFSGGVQMGEGINGQDIWGNALSPEERQQRLAGGALRSALSVAGGAASLGKLGALSKPTLGGLAGYGTFSDGQDIGAAITGTDMQGNSLDAMERLKRGGMGVLGAVDLAGPGGRYPLTPESHGGVGGKSIPGHDRLNNFDNPIKNPQKSPELAKATVPTTIGGVQHKVVPRKVGDNIEFWVCTACGNLKSKIDAMIDNLSPSQKELHAQLTQLRDKVEYMEGVLKTGKEPGKEEEFVPHQKVFNESAKIAKRFQELGEQHQNLGKALDEPKLIAKGNEQKGKTSSGETAKDEPVKLDNLGVETGRPQVVDVKDFNSLKLEPDTQVLYVLRDRRSGAIVKVGKTVSGEKLQQRFKRYKLANKRLKLELQLEVTSLGDLQGQTAQYYEELLRGQLGNEGNILPWDNTTNRLDRQGPGTPFEPLSSKSSLRKEGFDWNKEGYLVKDGAPVEFGRQTRKDSTKPTKEKLIELLVYYEGDTKKIAEKLGIDSKKSTLGVWLNSYELKSTEYKKSKANDDLQ
jgi:archaellum component FlaC